MACTIREIIVAEARRRGWSCYRLARESGVAERTLQAFFAGERDIASDKADKLFSTLDLEVRPAKSRVKAKD
ncbi:MAG: hypothetical protein IPM64_14060 [Phycisphaerales bacterium]|nr:hypothetical protein [Phycisphaerales bacterium]